MKRIHDSLLRVVQSNRIVVWYDSAGEWKDAFASFTEPSIQKLTVEGNEFGTKVRIVRDPNPAARFLLYIPTERPADAENWLLDILLQGHEFKADKASLVLQDVGLPQEFRHLAEEHAAFFRADKRLAALRPSIRPEDQARDIRLKMMAILCDAPVDVDAILLHFLATYEETPPFDPVAPTLDAAALTAHFWTEVERRFGYTSETPNLLEFGITLFRSANPLDTQTKLQPHAKVFLQRWQDSQGSRDAFDRWSVRLQVLLHIEEALEAHDNKAGLGDADAFELFEKYTLRRLVDAFGNGTAAVEVRASIQQRRGSFWWTAHQHGYAALEHALELRELLAAAELTMDSIDSGLARYVASWWRIDRAYRRCMRNLLKYSNVGLMGPISRWVEKAYINQFLLPLTDRWSDHVRGMAHWHCQQLTPQRSFYEMYVRPPLERGQKVFVIISDALRYEAAVDFAEQLRTTNRYSAEVEALFGSLPTYTQLGMASLLSGSQYSIDPASANVTVDGQSATGTENRAKVLNARCGGKAAAVKSEDFLLLNTKTDGRDLMKAHDVVYIFHNHIDKVGDALGTEARTLEAVHETFNELLDIIKKVAAINGTNMLLTADHGFIFQQDDVADSDMTPLPAADALHYRSRRFAFGNAITPNPAVKVFTAAALGVGGDWSVAFPLSLGRFPQSASGKRFVHGGTSLQEVVVPVVKIHKARADDTGQIEVELMGVPPKITTGQLAVSLFQNVPAIGKVLPRTLRIGVFAKDDTCISEVKTVVFDSKEGEDRLRDTKVVLVMSPAADAYNNMDVVLRLEQTVAGTNQRVVYKSHTLKLQKRFTSDFDD